MSATVEIVGWVSRVERRKAGGHEILAVTFKTSHKVKGEWVSEFWTAEWWDAAASGINLSAESRDRVGVRGRLSARAYIAKDGTARCDLRIQFPQLFTPQPKAHAESSEIDGDGSDIPF